MSEPATKEDVKAILHILNDIRKRLDKIEGKDALWVNKKKAMQITGYSSSTLIAKVKAGEIPVNKNPKQGRQLQYNVINHQNYPAE